MKLLCFPLLLLLIGLQFSCASSSSETLVYFGTYTKGSSEGIYVSKLNTESGALSTPQLAAQIENPSFVAVLPDAQVIPHPFRVIAGCILIGATQSAARAIQLYGPVWTARTIRDEVRELMCTHFIGVARDVIVVDEQCL